MNRIKIIMLFIFLAVVGFVALQNTDPVSLDFLFWKTTLSLLVLIALTAGGAFLVGFLCGFGISGPGGRSKARS